MASAAMRPAAARQAPGAVVAPRQGRCWGAAAPLRRLPAPAAVRCSRLAARAARRGAPPPARGAEEEEAAGERRRRRR